MNHDYQAQRIDFITRSEFPELITRIYKLEESNYGIYIENEDHPLKENNSIHEKLKSFINNGKSFILNAFDIHRLDAFLSILGTEKFRKIIEQIKFCDFENINTNELNELLKNQLFQSFTSNYFDDCIRFITVNIRIITFIPDNFISILPPIQDNQIVSGFKGVFLNMRMLIGLLCSNFPTVIFGNIKQTNNREIFIEIDKYSYKTVYHKIQNFLNGLDSSLKYIIKVNVEIIERKVAEVELFKENSTDNPVLEFMSPFLVSSLEFEQRDEVLFFENIERIYTGDYKKTHLHFYSPDSFSCFLDFSWVVSNPLNIRNYLLWYDKLYITPPALDMWGQYPFKDEYNSTLKAFRNEHKIEYDEILNLIKNNRIYFIIQQPIQRYDIGFLNEVYRTNHSAIISRRAINTLLLMDIVDIFNSYPLKDVAFLKNASRISYDMAQILNCSPQFLYDFIMWPIKCYRKSLEVLTFNTHLRFSNIGINSIIQDIHSAQFKRDLTFEYSFIAPNIHIANALNATYFCSNNGFQDDFYALNMGNLLNAYKTFSNVNQELIPPIFTKYNSPIELFEVNQFKTVAEVNEIYKTFDTAKSGQPLLRELYLSKKDDLEGIIQYYNKAILETKSNANSIKWVWDLSYLGVTSNPLITAGFHPAKAFISSIILGAISLAIDKSFNTNLIQKYAYKAIQSYHGNNILPKNIHFLDKISRVAKFKTIY